MNHIDLFSGIGGFAYAAREVWGKDYNNLFFCEINKYCQAVLRKNFGEDILIYEDIRKVTANAESEQNRRLFKRGVFSNLRAENKSIITNPQSERCGEARQHSQRPAERLAIDLLTGGFPCQPFSQAGKRKGTDDDRYLWPEMLRVIREFKPTWVIAENVRGLLTIGGGVVFEQVCADMEGEGYDVQPVIIPACAVNAPHRRDRVWIVGYSESARGQEAISEVCQRKSTDTGGGDGVIAHTINDRCGRTVKKINGQSLCVSEKDWEKRSISGLSVGATRVGGERRESTLQNNDPDSILPRLQRGKRKQSLRYDRQLDRNGSNQKPDWSKNWLEVATEFCGMDDGLPVELHELKLSKSKHREERLKALGNAIVPQVVIEIMNAIKLF